MYLNFSNFRGRTSAGGGKPWSKNVDKCRMGGLANFRPMGGPPVPPGKKHYIVILFRNTMIILDVVIGVTSALIKII